MHYHVIAAGDSFNDIAMLKEADTGFFFHSPEAIKKQFPEFQPFEEYAESAGCDEKGRWAPEKS